MAKYKNQKKKLRQKRLEKQQELQQQQNDGEDVNDIQQKQSSQEPNLQKKIKKEQKMSNKQARSVDYYVNPMLEAFYRVNLKEDLRSEQDFQEFWAIMKEKLPVTFRLSPNIINFENYQNRLLGGKEYIKQFLEDNKIEDEKKEKESEEEKQEQIEQNNDLQQNNQQEKQIHAHYKINDIDAVDLFPVKYYPGNLAFQVDVTRFQLRKGQILKKFHSELQKATDAGLATRQELVSMLPPLLLDPQPSDMIFDMCAAPGSKTGQLLEIMIKKAENPGKVTGCVVANDINTERAYMLTHQLQRNSTSAMVVINHEAQYFPNLRTDEDENEKIVQFDKVLADVPCTGDGAIRKIPKKFSDWTTKDCYSLYSLQLAILMRAIQICKEGGLIVYSTCSINPIEDEAVVTEAFRRALPDSLELVDCHERLPHLKGRKGLLSWPVLVNKLKKKNLYGKTAEEVQNLKFEDMFIQVTPEKAENFSEEEIAGEQQLKQIKKCMFPDSEEKMKALGIEKTMRILPHDQNTGGFYLALIQKKKDRVFLQEQSLEKEYQMIQELFNNKDVVDEEQIQLQEMKGEKIDLESKTENNNNQENILIEQQQQEDMISQQKQPQEQEIQQENGEQIQKSKKQQWYDSKFEDFEEIKESEFQTLKNDYGLENLDKTLLYSSTKGVHRNIKLVSPAIRNLLRSDPNKKLKIVNIGSRAFKKEHGRDDQFTYRLVNDAIQEIFPYLTKRVMEISFEEYKLFLKQDNIKLEELKQNNPYFYQRIVDFGPGSVAITFQVQGKREVVVGQIFSSSISMRISKEEILGYNIIY